MQPQHGVLGGLVPGFGHVDVLAEIVEVAADERVEQLCGLEAMSQIHAWKSDFEPDRVTAYAKGATKLAGRALIADGAAFRSKRRWYDLRFRCELSPDQAAIVAFEFRVGEPVPRSQWAKLGLPERY